MRKGADWLADKEGLDVERAGAISPRSQIGFGNALAPKTLFAPPGMASVGNAGWTLHRRLNYCTTSHATRLGSPSLALFAVVPLLDESRVAAQAKL